MSRQTRIYVAGHSGMVGSAVLRQLAKRGNVETIIRTHEELDLTNQAQVADFFETEKPDQVYLAAARVGGIHANNSFPAEFIYENLLIEANVIHSAFRNNVKKLLFLGSSCIYPINSPQPMSEDCLLAGQLEPTNEPYAIAKIAGIKLCESYNRQYGQSHGIDYRSLLPCNLYGPGDNFHPDNSHVIPALIRRFHEAKTNRSPSVTIWGTGNPKREFLYVDDLAAGALHVMDIDKAIHDQHTQPMLSHINIGYGQDITIRELADIISEIVGYEGALLLDPTKPDGAPRKLMDSSRIREMGWRPKTDLAQGLQYAYEAFLERALKNHE